MNGIWNEYATKTYAATLPFEVTYQFIYDSVVDMATVRLEHRGVRLDIAVAKDGPRAILGPALKVNRRPDKLEQSALDLERATYLTRVAVAVCAAIE